MITLEAAQTLRGKASVASKVTVSVFGMELAGTTETYKLLYQGQPGTSTSTLYTVPGATVAFIRSIHVVNNDSSARSFKLYIGGTADANDITPDISITAGGMAVYENGAWHLYDSNGNLQMSIASGAPSGPAGGDLTGTYPNPTLILVGPGAIGPIGDATHVSTVTIDANGRVTALTSTAIVLAHSSLTGIGPNDHHSQSHVLATTVGLGADHTTSGLTAGQVLRASGATTAVFVALAHADLSGIGSNDHHNAVTIGADGEHSLATQVLSGVDASASQKGHLQVTVAHGLGVASGVISVADFVAAGGSHASGTVPDPGASAGTNRLLKDSATWVEQESIPDVQVFNSSTVGNATQTSATWTKPTGNYKRVKVLCIGGGAGGGSGASVAAAAAPTGGGGGGGASRAEQDFSFADCGGTEAVKVGDGGSGGVAVTNAAGNAGKNGGASSFNVGGVQALRAQTGGGGAGGSQAGSAALGGSAGSSGFAGGAGGPSGTAGAVGVAAAAAIAGPGGGGGGGGITAATPGVTSAGGTGGAANLTGAGAPAGGTAGAGAGGGAGAFGTDWATTNASPGPGGGGGGSESAAGFAGGPGGKGTHWGGGGGGGGASRAAAASGAGGDGAPGIVIVISY